MSITGKFFLHDTHEHYRIGKVLAAVYPTIYLVEFEIDGNIPDRGNELVSLAEMLKCDDCGSKHWHFYDTREARQAWIDWVNTPDEKPQVVTLVQKKKK
jgi:hypothetical protein